MMKKKKLKKTKTLCELVFDYVFRDFEDLRLSCVHDCYDKPLNEYVVFKAVPGFINAFRGLKVWEKTSNILCFESMKFSFSNDVHCMLQKVLGKKKAGMCIMSKRHPRWRRVREEIGQEILQRVKFHESLRYDCAGSLTDVAPFLDVKSREELLMKIEMWEVAH